VNILLRVGGQNSARQGNSRNNVAHPCLRNANGINVITTHVLSKCTGLLD